MDSDKFNLVGAVRSSSLALNIKQVPQIKQFGRKIQKWRNVRDLSLASHLDLLHWNTSDLRQALEIVIAQRRHNRTIVRRARGAMQTAAFEKNFAKGAQQVCIRNVEDKEVARSSGNVLLTYYGNSNDKPYQS